MATAYDYGIRQGLRGKGVSDADIGYDPTTRSVTVKGQSFMQPKRDYLGTTFTDRPGFESAWQAYQKGQQQPQMGGGLSMGAGGTPGIGAGGGTSNILRGASQVAGIAGGPQPITQPQQPVQPPQQLGYNQQIADIMQQLQQMTGPQQPVDVRQSPEYAAYAATSARRQQEGVRASQEALGSSGFGRSTTLGEAAGRVAGQEQEFLESQVVPQLMAQQEARRQQEFQNQLAILQPILQQQEAAQRQAEAERQFGLQEAQLTGEYMPPGAQEIVNQIMQLKQQAEAPTITREARTGLSQQADVLRNQLAGMGVDISRIGAGTAAGRAFTPGIQTLGARQVAQQQAQQEWENTFAQEQFTEQKASRLWEQAFQEKDFKQQMKEAAANRGLDWARINQQQQHFIADQAFREKQFQQGIKEFEVSQEGKKAETEAETDESEEEAISIDNLNFLTEKYMDPDMTRESALADAKKNQNQLLAKDYQELLKWINSTFD